MDRTQFAEYSQYNNANQLITRVAKDYISSSPSGLVCSITHYDYDSYGRVIREVTYPNVQHRNNNMQKINVYQNQTDHAPAYQFYIDQLMVAVTANPKIEPGPVKTSKYKLKLCDTDLLQLLDYRTLTFEKAQTIAIEQNYASTLKSGYQVYDENGKLTAEKDSDGKLLTVIVDYSPEERSEIKITHGGERITKRFFDSKNRVIKEIIRPINRNKYNTVLKLYTYQQNDKNELLAIEYKIKGDYTIDLMYEGSSAFSEVTKYTYNERGLVIKKIIYCGLVAFDNINTYPEKILYDDIGIEPVPGSKRAPNKKIAENTNRYIGRLNNMLSKIGGTK